MSQATADAYDALARAHGDCEPVARTVINSASDGDMIVSTVLLISDHSFVEGFFCVYETKVFGGRCDGQESWTRSVPGLAEGIRTAMLRHTEAIELIVDCYLSGDSK